LIKTVLCFQSRMAFTLRTDYLFVERECPLIWLLRIRKVGPNAKIGLKELLMSFIRLSLQGVSYPVKIEDLAIVEIHSKMQEEATQTSHKYCLNLHASLS
jgi:hypothetical protein